MRISPPLAISGLLLLAVAVMAWLPSTGYPTGNQTVPVTIELPKPVYETLARQLRNRSTENGQQMSVAQAIADLTVVSVDVPAGGPPSAPGAGGTAR